MDREAWHAAVQGVTKSQTWLSNWIELNWSEWGVDFRKIHYAFSPKCESAIVSTRAIPWSSYEDFNFIPTFLLVFSHFFHVYCSYLCMCVASLVSWQVLDSFSLPKVMMITKYVCLVALSCLTLSNPMDCSPLGSSVYSDSPGKWTGVGCHALLQGIFPTQWLNLGVLHYR